MAATKKPTQTAPQQESAEGEDVLRDMVKTLDELPTEVLEQLLKNLEEIEEYEKTHPTETE